MEAPSRARLSSRPRELSVTRIERWIANPYEIFAKDILKLEPMNRSAPSPTGLARPNRASRAAEFFGENPDELPADIEAGLIRVADRHFERLGGSPFVKAFWRPQFQRFARWFAATEPARREGIARILTEIKGALDLAAASASPRAPTASTCRRRHGRDLRLQDRQAADAKRCRQAVRAAASSRSGDRGGGGFAVLGAARRADLLYINASGRDEGGEDERSGEDARRRLAGKALES